MICKNCGKEFEGKFCPECAAPSNAAAAAPVQIARKKYKFGSVILIIIGVFVFIGIIGALFGKDEPSISTAGSQSQANGAAAPSSKAESALPQTQTEFGINDPATYKDTKLTVTNVEKSSGSNFDKPKDGMEFVIVTVEYENTGNDRISYNPYDFEMQNSQGQINSQTFSIANSETALSSGDLAAGGKVSGTIIFEEPVGDTNLSLIYTGSLFSNNEKLTFKLQ